MQNDHTPTPTDALDAFRASIARVHALASTLDANPAELQITEQTLDLAPLDDEAPDTGDSLATPMSTAIMAALDSLDAEVQQAVESLDHLDDAASALEHLAPLVAHLTQASAGADDTLEQLETRQQAIVEAAGTFASSIADGHDTETSHAFTNVLHTVSHELTHDLDSAVDNLNDSALRHLDDFLSQSSDGGDELAELWRSLLHDAASEIGETLSQELKSAFRDAIDQGVQLLAREVAGAGAKMVAGEATTSAMAPVIPYLVAARAALKVLNALKGFFGL